jgi:cell division protein FtsX
MRDGVPGGDRRRTTAWRTRRRYRLVRRLLTVAGLAIALAVVAASVAALPDPGDALRRPFLLQAAAIVAAGGLAPWLVVDWLWRRTRRRNLWEWQ